MRLHSLIALVLFAACLWGCYNPELGDTPFRCAADDGKKCPSGYVCRDRICVREDATDGALPDRAPLTDAELMPSKDGMVYIDGAPSLTYDNCDDSDVEPNNTAADATRISGSGVSTLPGWHICPAGDVDQYALELEEGDSVLIEVIFDHKRGDLDAALFDPDGFLVAAARSETDNETIRLPLANKTGRYILGVYGFGPVTNTYGLKITW